MSDAPRGGIPAGSLTFLRALRDQFLRAGERHSDLTFHYVERPIREVEVELPAEEYIGPSVEFHSMMVQYRLTFDGYEKWMTLTQPTYGRYEARFSGSGREFFDSLAETASGLLTQLRPSTPLIPPLKKIVDSFPKQMHVSEA